MYSDNISPIFIDLATVFIFVVIGIEYAQCRKMQTTWMKHKAEWNDFGWRGTCVYTYKYNGKEYTGRDSRPMISMIQATRKTLSMKDGIDILVNPQHPEKSVMDWGVEQMGKREVIFFLYVGGLVALFNWLSFRSAY